VLSFRSSLFYSTIVLLIINCGAETVLAEGRPNIVVIVSDDQRYGTTREFMPQTQSMLFDRGVTFSRAYVTTPACCPSRASIFTGKNAARHGVLTNNYRLYRKTFMKRLAESGYYVGLVGKYLNTWDGAPRREFDYWVSFRGGAVDYFDPRMNVNGRWKQHEGYVTDILGRYAQDFLKKAGGQDRPFLLVFTPNSPHGPSLAAREDENLPIDPSAYTIPAQQVAADEKPHWLQRLELTRKKQKRVKGYPAKQLRCLPSLDRVIGGLMQTLKEIGREEETVVFYLSDNGVMWGEYGLNRKDVAYEPAVHVPFAVRHPSLVKEGRLNKSLVANIDLAPTIYELAGVRSPGVDGLSLLPLLRNENSAWTRSHLVLDGFGNIFDKRPAFLGYHTGDFKYIRSGRGGFEAYDLTIDPYEVKNVVRDPNYREKVFIGRNVLRVFRRRARRINAAVLHRDGRAVKNPYKRNPFRKRKRRRRKVVGA
jgi:N-acetylglucosamine-6-sulfatase